MNTPDKNIPATPRHLRRRSILKGIGIALGGSVAVILLILSGISIFLSPQRLTDIVNREASEWLEADIEARDIDYTLWSSFPRFRISTGSINVRSRTLDSIPEEIRRQLPENCDFLGSLRSFSGSINLIDLLLNRYVIHDVKVDGLTINLVAYNDSINNYSIIPAMESGEKSVPYFSAELVSLHDPGALTYFSKSSDTHASLQLSDLTLRRVEKGRKVNDYKLTVSGRATATTSGITVLNKFPFSLGGDLQLHFDPFGFRLKNYAIDLGSLRSRLTMDVGIGENPGIESFDYHISTSNIMSLLAYIPQEYIPSLEGLSADMPVDASARLLSAWKFSDDTFPSLEIDFTIPEGNIDYTVSLTPDAGSRHLHTYSLDHSAIRAAFIFDGEHPDSSYLDVKPFILSTPGLQADLSGRITRLTSTPLVRTSITLNADIAEALRNLPDNSGMKASGRLQSEINLDFMLSGFSSKALQTGFEAVGATGKFNLSDVRIDIPAENISLIADNMKVEMNESAADISPAAMQDPASQFLITVGRATALIPGGEIRAKGVRLSTKASLRGDLTPERLNHGLPLTFSLAADNVAYDAPETGIRVSAKNPKVSDFVATRSPSSFRQALSDGLTVSAERTVVSAGNTDYIILDPRLQFAVAERKEIPFTSLEALPLTPSPAKGKGAEPVKPTSTPGRNSFELLTLNTPSWVSGILNRFSFSAGLKADRCYMRREGKVSADRISDIDLSLDEEALTLHNLSMDLSATPARIHGRIGNLRGFLTRQASADNPLEILLDADITRIDINSLARNYVKSKGGENNIPRHDTVTAEDSVTLLVPRNIKADIKASVGEIDYTDLHLTDVGADIAIADGVADIGRLTLASSFGSADASFLYDSSSAENLKLTADVNLKNLNIVNFFRKFHSLLEMMPEMKNLSGDLSMQAKMGVDIFPDMYLNIPSAFADMALQGRNLKVHQSEFIRKITKMMLIRTDADIHIKDMEVHAAMRDNLLQLYPFNFEFDRYKLHMLGVNNFNGRLYYHIAVDKSPVPFPFAINVEGMFADPKLRFGGPDYDIKRGEEVTSEIQESNSINMMKVLKGFMREFICTAARSDK